MSEHGGESRLAATAGSGVQTDATATARPYVGVRQRRPGTGFGRAWLPQERMEVETRPSFMTSELLGTILAITAVAIYNAVSDGIDARLTWILIAGLVSFYVLSRGIAKAGEPSRAFDPRDELRLGDGGDGAGAGAESTAAGTAGRAGMAAYRDEWIETRPSFLTSEFVGTVVTIVALAIHNAVSDGIDASLTWILIVGLTAVYLVSRGLAKSGTGTRAFDPRDQLGRDSGWANAPLSRDQGTS